MKITTIINYLGWASGIFGGLLMLCGVIGFFTGKGFLGVQNYWNYFFLSFYFIVFGIFLLVGARSCCCCDCKDDQCCDHEHHDEKAK